MKTSKKGFTLIELLVVIGIIAVIASGIGIALRGGGDRGFALSGAQSTVSSLLTGTRGQAALAQSNAMLVLTATSPEVDGFMREFRIAVETPAGSNRWRFTAEPTSLPQGIYVVPRTTGLTGATLPAGWPNTLLSTILQETAPISLNDPSGVAHPGQFFRVITFTSRGTTGIPSGNRLVLSAASRSATGIEFIDQNTVRGMTLSAYGVATLINDAIGFQ